MTEEIDMSDAVTRFSPYVAVIGEGAYGDMSDDPTGDWVRYEDYEALTARAEAAETRAYTLAVAIMGGEDAPGYADSVPSDDLSRQLRKERTGRSEWTDACVKIATEAAEKALAEVTKKRDEYAERIEELEHACEIVSSEFEGELWQSCRRILEKTDFDFHGADVDGIQADDFEGHINETLVEFDSLTARIATVERETLERAAAVCDTGEAGFDNKYGTIDYASAGWCAKEIRAMIEEKTDE